MAVFKDSYTGTWAAAVRYKDYTGKKRLKKRTGFEYKRDAAAWEKEFIDKQNLKADKTFNELCDLYLEDQKNNHKLSTYETKRNRIDKWVRPAFKDRKINEIEAVDIRQWQTDLKKAEGAHGKPLSPGYMHNLLNELSSIFNYAVKFYGLAVNPCRAAGNVVGNKNRSMLFWTRDQFQKFIDTFDKSDPFYAFFMVMYYTGMRRGEALALTVADVAGGRITINKTFNVIGGKEVITTPKTSRSVREVTIPETLEDIITAHIGRIYGAKSDTRIFSMISRSAAAYQLDSHAKKADVPRIRVHDLRHSHASLLIDMGFSAILVSQRLGHEDTNTTLRVYAHLFPDRQNEVAARLDEVLKCNESVTENEHSE